MTLATIFFIVTVGFACGSLADAKVQGDCNVPMPQGTNQTFKTDGIEGLSEWCSNGVNRRPTDTWINPKCCTAEYSCEWWVDQGETKDGLTNPCPYRRRTCVCEELFYECITDSMAPWFRLKFRLGLTFQPCNRFGKWVSSHTWLGQWVN